MESSSIFILFIAVNFIILIFILFWPAHSAERFIRIFTHILNTQVAQRFLVFCFLFEQLILIHPFIPFLLVTSFTFLYLFCLSKNILFFLLLHTICSLYFIYVRLRKSLLNAPAFSEVGMLIENQPLSWKNVLVGLSRVLEDRLRKASNSNCSHLDNTLESSSSSLRFIVGRSSIDSRILIKNRLPRLNIVFPFFPTSFRRTMTTRTAIKDLIKLVTQTAKEEPIQAATLIFTAAGAVAGAGTFIYKDVQERDLQNRQLEQRKQEMAQIERHHQEDLAERRASREENRMEFDQVKKRLDVLEKEAGRTQILPPVKTDPASSLFPTPNAGAPTLPHFVGGGGSPAMGANIPEANPPSPRAGGDFVPSPLEKSYFSIILDFFL